jgi:nucleoside-diphosphate-sugar epimerase
VDMVAGIAGKAIIKRHIGGPTGVRGRNSDNRLIRERLRWSPSTVLADGLRPTYAWISSQVTRTGRAVGETLQGSEANSQNTMRAAE